MTPQEQSRMQRIAQVVESYAQQGIAVSVEERDNWASYSSTQIFHMRRRAVLPPHFSYRITFLNKEGKTCPTQ
jgi:hypothetical protein